MCAVRNSQCLLFMGIPRAPLIMIVDECDPTGTSKIFELATRSAHMLRKWRQKLPSKLAWKDDDPPAARIDIARMRAEFYGGACMVTSPALRMVLNQHKPRSEASTYTSDCSSRAHSKRVQHTLSTPSIANGTSHDVIKSAFYNDMACQCINYAIQNIKAFSSAGEAWDFQDCSNGRESEARLFQSGIHGLLSA